MMKRTGFPKAAFRTLAEHSSLDVHHLEELNSTFDELPISRMQEMLDNLECHVYREKVRANFGLDMNLVL